MNRFLSRKLATSAALALTASVAVGAGLYAAQAPAGGAAPAGGQGRGGAAPGAPGAPAGGGGRGGGGAPITVTGTPRQKAHADIAGPNGITGTADFNEYPIGNYMFLEVILAVQGLPAGMHGVHIHAVGKCEAPAFTTAGGHFDPGPAGNTDADLNHPFHSGDLPNLSVNAGRGAPGTPTAGNVTFYTTRFGLSGPLSIGGPDGTAIIIHADPDLLTPGPAGSGVAGGARLACGVIKKI